MLLPLTQNFLVEKCGDKKNFVAASSLRRGKTVFALLYVFIITYVRLTFINVWGSELTARFDVSLEVF